MEEFKEYKMTVGLEVHAELSTKTKAYCSCKNAYGEEANTNICPICMGLPGALPSFNEEVLKYAIKAGLATNCNIIEESKFDRKNYFYPDLSKGYQISQHNKPICYEGYLEIGEGENKKKIGIERIHMEEDTAKMTKDPFGRGNLIDFNRCGVPLIEIVSKPDIHTIEDAIDYLETLRKLLIYLGVAECKMEEGGFRADVNISVSNTDKFGNRAEIKNMNSFKSIERALKYEYERQVKLAKEGKKIEQETLRWDDVLGETEVMRKKEKANDYRYFLESDLPMFKVPREQVSEINNEMPELLNKKKERYIEEFNLSDKQIIFILSDIQYIKLFENAEKLAKMPIEIANYLMTDIAAYVNENVISPEELKVTPQTLAELVLLHKENVLNSKTGKIVVKEMLETGKNPKDIVKEKGLIQITDEKAIEEIVEKVLEENEQSIEDYKNGKDRALGFLVGQAMKLSKGKANPKMVNEIMINKLNNR